MAGKAKTDTATSPKLYEKRAKTMVQPTLNEIAQKVIKRDRTQNPTNQPLSSDEKDDLAEMAFRILESAALRRGLKKRTHDENTARHTLYATAVAALETQRLIVLDGTEVYRATAQGRALLSARELRFQSSPEIPQFWKDFSKGPKRDGLPLGDESEKKIAASVISVNEEPEQFLQALFGEKIEKKPTVKEFDRNGAGIARVDVLLNALDKLAENNPNQPPSTFARPLLLDFIGISEMPFVPSKVVPPLPKRATERWPSDQSKRTETPIEFALRVYRPWMEARAISKQDLKKLDPLLFSSVDSWLKNNNRKDHPAALPDGFCLLTQAEVNDTWVKRVQKGEAPMPTDPAELARFAMALRYRGRTVSER